MEHEISEVHYSYFQLGKEILGYGLTSYYSILVGCLQHEQLVTSLIILGFVLFVPTLCSVLLLKVVFQRSHRVRTGQSKDTGTNFQRTLHQGLSGHTWLSYR